MKEHGKYWSSKRVVQVRLSTERAEGQVKS